MAAIVHTRPTKVQGMAFERCLLALEDSHGAQTLPHACLRIEYGGQVCRRRWYHPWCWEEVNVKAEFARLGPASRLCYMVVLYLAIINIP